MPSPLTVAVGVSTTVVPLGAKSVNVIEPVGLIPPDSVADSVSATAAKDDRGRSVVSVVGGIRHDHQFAPRPVRAGPAIELLLASPL